jgi:single-strand DNA-binding protein
MNKVFLLGRLGQDPELRYSQNGTPVCTFSLATNERVQTADGNWEDRPEWHRIVCFQKTAELAANYLAKGRQVLIEGKIQTQSYDDNEGVRRYITKIIAHRIEFVGGQGGERESETPKPAPGKQPAPGFGDSLSDSMLPEPPANVNDDDIPF